MGGDWCTATADALFGRALRDANQLLWAEDAGLPELRGSEQGDPAAEAAFADDQPRVDVSAASRFFRLERRPSQHNMIAETVPAAL